MTRHFLALAVLTAAAIPGSAILRSETARAAEPSPRSLLPEKPALVVEWNRPARLYDHPLVRSVWSEIEKSAEYKRQIESPELDRLRQLQQFLETATGDDWITALDRLTAGGMAMSVVGQLGSPPELTAVLVAEDAAVLRKTIDAFQSAVLSRIPAESRPAALPSESHRGLTCVKIGNVSYAVDGRRLLFANRGEALRAAIDRLKSAGDSNGSSAGKTVAKSDGALLTVELDLAQIRKTPDVAKTFAIPGNDIGLLFVFGGWIDVLGRADKATAEVSLSEKTMDVRLRIDAGKKGARPGLAGYFATEGDARALPLLRVPNMIAAGSYYRDYAAMWNKRTEVLSPEALKRLEEGNAQATKQFEVLGARFTPSDLIADMGTHFRYVVARQSESVYKVDLDERLPASAALVDMRSAGFREKLTPLLRFSGIIAAADGRRMVTNVETYKECELTSFRFREDAETQAMGSRQRYQFSPTYGFAHNHLVFGSTTEIVHQVIDALEEESKRPATAPDNTTESDVVSLKATATALSDFRSVLLNSSVLNNGLSLGAAEHELGVFLRALESLQGATARTTFDDDKLEVHLRIGE